jgi:hypothetical protein
MVPGSTFRYGSSFWTETLRPRLFRIVPIEATVIPFPTELTTPPVTNIYLVISRSAQNEPQIYAWKHVKNAKEVSFSGNNEERLWFLLLYGARSGFVKAITN